MRVRRQDVTSLVADLIMTKSACTRVERRPCDQALASRGARSRLSSKHSRSTTRPWKPAGAVSTLRAGRGERANGLRVSRPSNDLHGSGEHTGPTEANSTTGQWQRVWRISSPRQGPSHQQSSGATAPASACRRRRWAREHLASADADGAACGSTKTLSPQRQPVSFASLQNIRLTARVCLRDEASTAMRGTPRARLIGNWPPRP